MQTDTRSETVGYPHRCSIASHLLVVLVLLPVLLGTLWACSNGESRIHPTRNDRRAACNPNAPADSRASHTRSSSDLQARLSAPKRRCRTEEGPGSPPATVEEEDHQVPTFLP